MKIAGKMKTLQKHLFVCRQCRFVTANTCVDMSCDGKKKLLIKDLDGSFFGTPSNYIPESEYEYNGDPRHGFGDYRIPKTMKTFPGNGSRIPIADVLSFPGDLIHCFCFIKKRVQVCHK